MPRREVPWLWPALAMLAACVPFVNGTSLTKVFYIRDLTMFFWPRHLWIRDTLLAGHWPLWDPYAAAGQAAFPDALNQLFLPPVLLLRTLLPAVLGFNLIVAAPFPLAALGTWLFLRRHVSRTSATLGAIVFSVSGPVVSTANFPNLSWSVAWIPWLLWALDRDRRESSWRSFSLIVAIVALQVFSGEPVTMTGTLALAVAYVVACAEPSTSAKAHARTVARLLGAIATAVVVSAVQLVPMALAAKASARGLMQADTFWSLHPLWLAESILPHVFGDTFQAYAQPPWIRPLNSGRDPFFYSLYVGPVVLLLSLLGTLWGPLRWRFFWLTVVVVGVVLAFGDYTPVYPTLQQLVAPLRTFRFPVKFFLFSSFGLAVLAANAANALQTRRGSPAPAVHTPWVVRTILGAGVAAAVALVALVSLVLVAPFTGARAFYNLGVAIGVTDPVGGAAFLFETIPPIATRVLILLLTSALLAYLGWAAQHEGRIARALLFSLATLELLAVNTGLNPVILASRLGPPAWTVATRTHQADRFYFGGKFHGTLVENDIDLAHVQWSAPRDVPAEEGRTEMVATLSMTPAAWGARELLSYDLPVLWPMEHAWAISLFERADQWQRRRFLARGGVRYCVVAAPPEPGVPAIQTIREEFGKMALYECTPDARRAYVVQTASVVPSIKAQLVRLFDESFDAESTVMLEQQAPAAVGSVGSPTAPSARILSDAGNEVTIEASAGADGGYLLLLDSFDRSWRVDVDGQPGRLLRANALYRAVHLGAGRHQVRFVYRPVLLYACALISGLAALALTILALRPPAKQIPSPQPAAHA